MQSKNLLSSAGGSTAVGLAGIKRNMQTNQIRN